MPKLQQHTFTWNRNKQQQQKTNKSETSPRNKPEIVQGNKKSTLSLMIETPFPTHCLSSLHSCNKKK